MTNPQRLQLIEMEVAEWPEWAQVAYDIMVQNGQTPVFAHMCVSREAWSVKNSDKAFNEGQRRKMSTMSEENRDNMCRAAQKAGINTNGKYYVGGLGKYTDPHAWVSTASDVIEVCRKKNLTATGVVNHKGTPMPRPKSVDLAPDIVQKKVGERLKADPRLAERVKKGRTDVRDVVAEVKEKHALKRKLD